MPFADIQCPEIHINNVLGFYWDGDEHARLKRFRKGSCGWAFIHWWIGMPEKNRDVQPDTLWSFRPTHLHIFDIVSFAIPNSRLQLPWALGFTDQQETTVQCLAGRHWWLFGSHQARPSHQNPPGGDPKSGSYSSGWNTHHPMKKGVYITWPF